MSEISQLQEVVDDWSAVVNLPLNHKPAAELLEENAKLARMLGLEKITLRAISEQPISLFHCLGSDIIWLTEEEVRWMLPVLLKHGTSSEEPIFARNVVNALEENLTDFSEWRSIKDNLRATSLTWLNEESRICCQIGWEDDKRIKKHTEICQSLFR